MDKASLNRVAKLHPLVADKARELISRAESEGISFIITQTLRTNEEQAALYAQGRTAPGQIVTNAKPGYSYHNYGLALDYCLLDRQGNVNWNSNDPKWVRIAQIGKELGFDWGGDWTSFKDYPHLEMTFGLSVEDLLAGKRPPEGGNTVSKPQVIKERIIAVGGALKYLPNGDYSQLGTDVRHIVFPRGTVDVRFVYQKDARVTELTKKYGADYGTNFPFFWQGNVLGDNQDHDAVISQAYGNMLKWHDFWSFNGEFHIGDANPDDPQDFLVQASPLLVDNGNPAWDYYAKQENTAPDIANSSAQRTFVGLDPSGALHVFIADGRTNTDKGLTLEEMGLYAIDKGCNWAMNGDGGSSTILSDSAGKGLNQSQNTGVNERQVHHALLFFCKEAQVQVPPADWKQAGLQYMRDSFGISEQWKATDTVDMGTLGELFKRVGLKKN